MGLRYFFGMKRETLLKNLRKCIISVGDGAFRKKSEQKMREIINGGATTILVSHSIDQVREMCNKILWLHKGRQIEFGDDVQGICDRYQELLDGTRKL